MSAPKAPCPLAVMQRTESCARLYYQRPDAYGRETPVYEQARLDKEAREARAKVAELVEAARPAAGAVEEMVTILENYAGSAVLATKLDCWLTKHAFTGEKALAALAAFSEVRP